MAILKIVARGPQPGSLTHPKYKMVATQPKLDLITKYIAELLSAENVRWWCTH